jgi:hypothetical protein
MFYSTFTHIAFLQQNDHGDLCKAFPGFFLCILSSLTCLKKIYFQQAESSAVEGTSQPVVKKSQLLLTEEKDLSTGPSPVHNGRMDFGASPKTWDL